MKKLLLITLFSLLYTAVFAQSVNFEDGFDDGDFTNNPTWTGADSNFVIIDENGNNLLQLNDNEAFTSFLSTPSTNVVGAWEFFIRYDGFSPSDGNRAEIFLMSDSTDLNSNLNGYKLRGGENGSGDVFRLYRVTGGSQDSLILSGTTDISGGGDFRVRVTRDASGNWTLETAQGYNGTLVEEANGTDNTYTTSEHFGLKAIYTSTRSDRFFFDFQIQTDTEAPRLLSSRVLDGNSQIELIFNEAIQETVAENLSNYQLQALLSNDFTSPTLAGAEYFSPDTVLLSTNTPFQGDEDGESYDLLISAQQDLEGNTSSDTTITFQFVEVRFGTSDSLDVVINEFVYDPFPVASEYIELFNRSDSVLNLQNWTLNDNTGTRRTISDDTLRIESGAYLVLAPDSSIIDLFPGIPLADIGSRFPALNNSGDAIVIRNENGLLIDSLTYDNDWGGTDIALERRDPNRFSSLQANWGDSPAPELGTPGSANQILPDTFEPAFSGFELINDDAAIRITYTEEIQRIPAEDISNYEIITPDSNDSEAPNIQSASLIAADTVIVTFTSPLIRDGDGESYSIYVSNQVDVFGNIAGRNGIGLFLQDFDEALPGDVIINEFTYDPFDGATEYIEIFNRSSKFLNIQDWTLNDNSGNRRVISDEEQAILSGSFLVLTTDSTLINLFPGIAILTIGSRFSSLNNSGDDIVIRDANGVLIDSLTYTSAWGGNNVALERRSSDPAFTSFQANWGDSPDPDLGTPGEANAIEADTTGPQIESFELLDGDSVLVVVFDEEILEGPATDPNNFELNIPLKASSSSELWNLIYLAPDTILVDFNGPLAGTPIGQGYSLGFSNQTDVFGNVSEFLPFDLDVIDLLEGNPGDVIINEFTYDPFDGVTEYIEIFNRRFNPITNDIINLKGWTINDNTGNRRAITNEDFPISEEYVVLAPDSTILEAFPGIPLIVVSSFPSLNNSGDDIVLRNADGVLIDSLTYNSDWGGNNVALERRSLDPELSTLQSNWGDSPAESGGTPGAQNLIGTDMTPPAIVSFTVLDNRTFQVAFTERIFPRSNFPVDSISFERDGLSVDVDIELIQTIGNFVTITLTEELPGGAEGVEYDFVIRGAVDAFDNVAEELRTSFLIVDIGVPELGTVIINEFMYDPAQGLTEFIELFNPSEESYDITGWTINDNTGTRRDITDGLQVIIRPNEYLVIAPDSTFADLFPGINLLTIGGRFAALNNSGDDIVLRSDLGVLLDSLTYTSDWGGDNVSLERRDSRAALSTFQENWGDSPSPNFATPGSANEVLPDTEGPTVEQVAFFSNTAFRLTYNETIDQDIAENAANYSFNPVLNATFVSAATREVVVFVDELFVDGQEYEITIRSAVDVFGNGNEDETVSITFFELSQASPDSVVINEILYRRADAESPEFVEIFNPSSRNFDLSGWILEDAGGNDADLPDGTVLGSGEYLVLTDLEDFANSIPNGVYLNDFPSLNDSGDAIILRNSFEITIDSLFYQTSWGGNTPGTSVERRDPLAASSDENNWTSSTNPNGNSAGTQNSEFEEDLTAPTVIFVNLINDQTQVQVVFSEFVEFNAGTTFEAFGQPATIAFFDTLNANQVILDVQFVSGIQNPNIFIENFTDVRGNAGDSGRPPIAFPITSEAIAINEIMFDPLSDNDDNLPDQTEYIELQNLTDNALSLEGIFLSDAPDEENDTNDLFPVSTIFRSVGPGDRILVYAEDQFETYAESRLAEFFENPGLGESNVIRVDRSSLSLSASGDAIFLRDSTGSVLDSVFYDEEWHNPNRFDTDGVSLEKIDPAGPSNDAANWSSSVDITGGTPGTVNTIFQQPDAAPASNDITFSPNPFSPSDQDGFEDNLFISYNLDEPDYLLRVRIFDRYGRKVRTLVDGEAAGFTGTLTWDGFTDDGNENRVGFYIVLFEAYNSANGRDQTFKETVVIARR